jgi:hypothetical protein
MIKKIIGTPNKSKQLARLVRIKDATRNEVIKGFIKTKIREKRLNWDNIKFFLPSVQELGVLIKIACET